MALNENVSMLNSVDGSTPLIFLPWLLLKLFATAWDAPAHDHFTSKDFVMHLKKAVTGELKASMSHCATVLLVPHRWDKVRFSHGRKYRLPTDPKDESWLTSKPMSTASSLCVDMQHGGGEV
jgi:hypothetical protein